MLTNGHLGGWMKRIFMPTFQCLAVRQLFFRQVPARRGSMNFPRIPDHGSTNNYMLKRTNDALESVISKIRVHNVE